MRQGKSWNLALIKVYEPWKANAVVPSHRARRHHQPQRNRNRLRHLQRLQETPVICVGVVDLCARQINWTCDLNVLKMGRITPWDSEDSLLWWRVCICLHLCHQLCSEISKACFHEHSRQIYRRDNKLLRTFGTLFIDLFLLWHSLSFGSVEVFFESLWA